MSQQLKGDFESDTFQSNQNDSDFGAQTNPEKNDISHNQLTSGDQFFIRIQRRRFICCACGEEVLEEKLPEHHAQKHSEFPFAIDKYELCEIDEQMQCPICHADLTEDNNEQHMKSHREAFDDFFDLSNKNVGFPSDPGLQSINNTAYDINQFRGIDLNYCAYAEQHFNGHSAINQTNAQMIPDGYGVSSNIFDIMDVDQNLKKNDDRIKPPKGFRNVCISDDEFYRLAQRNRIYINEGRLTLKDSK